MKKVKIKLFDSFTKQILGGNVAGVVTEADGLTDAEMQKIASEINAPTTGFAVSKGKNEFEVRFFTPAREIDMCGHVVVGTFMALAEEGKIDFGNTEIARVKQHTKAGLIPVEISCKNGKPASVVMKQNKPTFRETGLKRDEVAGLLGVSADSLGYPMGIASTALRHLFIPVKDLESIRRIKPDFTALADLSRKLNVETVCVFTLETVNPGFTVHDRDFSPAIGKPEEAASGTTNGALGCYMVKNRMLGGIGRNGKVIILAEQGYEMGRPSSIRTEITLENGEVDEVRVEGTAVCSMTGELLLE